MVQALLQAAERVQREMGGLGVTIHDLSYSEGGPIDHHKSHQNGRDVDVLFYQLGPDGKSIRSVGAFFDPTGRGVNFHDLSDPSDDVPLEIDLPRTWLFIQALIESPNSTLQRIFVADHIRTLLLQYAKETGAPELVIEHFSELTCQPPVYPHDDHIHLRFFCTADDVRAGCRDSEPIYPWRRAQLNEEGLEPLPLLPPRPSARSKLRTHEQARKTAGPMHEEVIRWLNKRKQWLDPPLTGRAYCP